MSRLDPGQLVTPDRLLSTFNSSYPKVDFRSSFSSSPWPVSWVNELSSIPVYPLPLTNSLPGVVVRLYPTVVHPAFPIAAASLYLFTVNLLSTLQNGRDRIRAAGRLGKALVVVHNAILAVYSAWSFWGTGPMIVAELYRAAAAGGWDGLKYSLCDADGTIWHRAIGDYTYVFYLSKIWEFLDTAILLLKGKKPEVLQTFHHAGAIIGTWAGVRYQTPPVWLFLVLNSFVHAWMYTYYTLSTLNVRIPRPLKRSLTTMQITQFLTGLAISVLYPIVRIPSSSPMTGLPLDPARGHHCLRDAGQEFGFWWSDGYVIVLTILFNAFYRKTYRGSTKNVKSAKKLAERVVETSTDGISEPETPSRRYNLRQRKERS